MMEDSQVRIAVIGSGYVGLVAAVCFAELGHRVVCVDNVEAKVQALRAGDSLIHEHFLPELLAKHRDVNLSFTTSLADAVRESQAIFIAVGTPPTGQGDADLSYVEAVACEIARSMNEYKVIVEKSTVPVYTSDWIIRVMMRNGIERKDFDVASNPEFLREGTAVSDFLHPDRIVIGADNERAIELLRKIYAPLASGTYYKSADAIPGRCSAENPASLLLTTPKSAELIKHASNAFLATKISFINAVANLCEAVDADIEDVAMGMGMDTRIGRQFLRAGIGYGGSCFPKDVAAFRAVANQVGLDFNILEEVEEINKLQKNRFLQKVRAALWTLRGKRLGVLGLAFKGDTDDIRESPAIDVIRALQSEGCTISAYDPAAMQKAKADLGDSIQYAGDAYEAAQGADALLVLTDWPQFATLDLARLKTALRYPIVIDGRNLFLPATMQEHGFAYVSMGRASISPIRELADDRPLPVGQTRNSR